MRMYKHWLKIDWRSRPESEDIQWNHLNEFLLKYPESKITVYNSETMIFEKHFCLETTQNYNELDLDVNSMSRGSIRHFDRKPNNLEKSHLSFKEHYNIHFSDKVTV